MSSSKSNRNSRYFSIYSPEKHNLSYTETQKRDIVLPSSLDNYFVCEEPRVYIFEEILKKLNEGFINKETLSSLTIGKNIAFKVDADFLEKSLRSYNNLKKLDLSNNNILWLKPVFELESLSSLQTLKLCDMWKFNDSDCNLIKEVFTTKSINTGALSNLTHLDLSSSSNYLEINSLSASIIANYIDMNKKLQKLNLKYNEFEEESKTKLINAILKDYNEKSSKQNCDSKVEINPILTDTEIDKIIKNIINPSELKDLTQLWKNIEELNIDITLIPNDLLKNLYNKNPNNTNIISEISRRANDENIF